MKLINGNCLDVMAEIPDNSIDLICTDLPYGVTNCSWDAVIPFNRYIIEKNKTLYWEDFLIKRISNNVRYDELLDEWKSLSKLGMWDHFKRITKDRSAILLFGMQPFSSQLVSSNLKNFRYEIIYEKGSAKGFLNAKKRPLNAHENILVFYKKLPEFTPLKTTGHPRQRARRHDIGCDVYGKTLKINDYDSTERYPRSVQFFSTDTQKSHLHPNQKPIKLMEWLIKSYSKEGQVVLDACMGSGSTGVACMNLGREFIGIEQDPIYFIKAKKRLSMNFRSLANDSSNESTIEEISINQKEALHEQLELMELI